jgi:oligopeptide transport system permease protein
MRYLLRDRLVLVCALFVGVLVIISIFPEQIAPLSYDQTSFPDKLATPGTVAAAEKLAGFRYLLGSDRLGRDILSRLIYGTRISIAVAFTGAVISLLIGVSYGLISGYSSSRVDNLMMRLVDVIYGYPTLILVILLQVYLTAISRQELGQTTGLQRFIIGLDQNTGGLFFVFVAIGAVSWLNMARLTRGQVLYYRNQEFVQAARAVGVPRRRILWRHLLPNALGPAMVAGTLAIPTYIYTEAFLSFIGLGVQPPAPSWGGMISDGYGAIRSAPHLIFPPALALFLTMLAFNFLGDAVRDALDPRIRHG